MGVVGVGFFEGIGEVLPVAMSGRPLFMIQSVVGDWVIKSDFGVDDEVSAGAGMLRGDSEPCRHWSPFLLVEVEKKRDMHVVLVTTWNFMINRSVNILEA